MDVGLRLEAARITIRESLHELIGSIVFGNVVLINFMGRPSDALAIGLVFVEREVEDGARGQSQAAVETLRDRRIFADRRGGGNTAVVQIRYPDRSCFA